MDTHKHYMTSSLENILKHMTNIEIFVADMFQNERFLGLLSRGLCNVNI